MTVRSKTDLRILAPLVLTVLVGLGLLRGDEALAVPVAGPGAAAAASEPAAPLQGLEVEQALWMQLDVQNAMVLVLAGEDWQQELAPRLLVLDLDGNLVRIHELPRLQNKPLAQVLYFPAAQKLAVGSYPYEDEAWLVDVVNGAVQRVASRLTTRMAADPERGLLYLAQRNRLQILEVEGGRTLAHRAFGNEIYDLTVGGDGTLNFLMENVGHRGAVDRLVSLDPDEDYRTEARRDLPNRGDWSALQAVDAERERLFVIHRWDLPQRERAALTLVQRGGSPTPLATAMQSPALFGFAAGARYLYLYDEQRCDSGVAILDARSMRRLGTARTLDGCHSTFLGRDADGNLLVTRAAHGPHGQGTALELREARTLRLLESSPLEGSVQLTAVDPEQQTVYLVLEADGGAGPGARLAIVDLRGLARVR